MHTKLEKLWHNMSLFSLNTVLGTLYRTNISCVILLLLSFVLAIEIFGYVDLDIFET